MTQTVSADNKVVADSSFLEPTVQPTYKAGGESAVDLLYYHQYTGVTAGGSVNLPDCSKYTHLLFLINTKSITGTTPSIDYKVFLVDGGGFISGGYFNVWDSGAISTAQQSIRGVGPGSDSVAPVPPNVQFNWSVGGTPVISFDVTVYGKRG